MKKIGICGHFGFGKELLNGQTIKTKVLTSELKKTFGEKEILFVDTHGGAKRVPGMCIESFGLFKNCRNIIMLPAYKGLCLFAPLYLFFNMFFKRKLHYVVIGGWLDKYLNHHKLVRSFLRKYDGIYVETRAMKEALERRGFHNIYVLNNCKELEILSEEQLPVISNLPYKLCTFSRVMLEKGIETAMEAVQIANAKHDRELFHLDIYGQIDKDYEERFVDIMKDAPGVIQYKGVVDFDRSVDVLKEYCALLFPTYYHGEGFAGTLIDAMASGVPVIASDWKYNSEIIKNEQTGILLRECTPEAIAAMLEWMLENMAEWDRMRRNCLDEAEKYLPEQVIKVLLHELV